eukprot:TRINITY_DN124679_c0_g1_i1.p1 TRINITY_DN124679_c0_g1~~TRINITY_DN124679_c0_g1_i1.p1  ORF type:complete len:477 (+),score=123.51 TRINITY_DN124679_c0_g1_i1:88-1518(+)
MATAAASAADQGLGRSPTFVVGSDKQQGTLDSMQRREQHFSEQYQKNKPLCFNGKAYQRTHPRKKAQGYKDADATLVSPMILGVADGVSQIEEFGIDASRLPNELLNQVEELAVQQLLPSSLSNAPKALGGMFGSRKQRSSDYLGPIAMLREAYESTECLGSTTVLMAVMDNSTMIHGKLHPMIAVLSVGDCEILILRRPERTKHLEAIFETEMQRIGGNAQAPLQVARVDDSVDPNFREEIAIEVIERGSAVHCVSAVEGDIVVLGSDGVFDNLYVDEIVNLCNEMLPPPPAGKKFEPTDRNCLAAISRCIVEACHAKTQPMYGIYPDAPIGRGGKVDDTSVVVAEIVEWKESYGEAWQSVRSKAHWDRFFSCGAGLKACNNESDEEQIPVGVRNYPSNPNGSFSTYWGSFSEYGDVGSFASLASGYSFGGSFASQTGQPGSYSSFAMPASRRGGGNRPEESTTSDDEDEGCSIM